MRFSSATAKMRANGASGGSRIGRGADGDDAANGDKSLEEETSTSTSTSSASAAARLAAAAPTAARRRRTASVSSSSGPKSINGKGDDHAPILAFSFLPGPLRKLFGGGGGGGGVGGGGEAAAKKKESKEEEEESDLAHYEELPDFLKDNDFVRSWYRRESTPRAAAASLAAAIDRVDAGRDFGLELRLIPPPTECARVAASERSPPRYRSVAACRYHPCRPSPGSRRRRATRRREN